MEGKASYREIVRLTLLGGYTQGEVAAAAGCSRATVRDVQRKLGQSGIEPDEARGMSEAELRGLLCAKRGKRPEEGYGEIDHERVQAELDRSPGLTLTILWEEYALSCAEQGVEPYKYSYFAQRHREWRGGAAGEVALKVRHAPGDRMEVDWAGTTMEWVDPYTGDAHVVYLFVATLPYSQHTFVKPTESMAMDDWIGANVAALRFFGGAPRLIVVDNLKTGVSRRTADEVVVNPTYREFAEHYGVAVVPAGVRRPTHKASVEGNVGKIGERIALMLRNQRFFSMEELEAAVAERLDDLDSRPFDKRDGSRLEVFLEKERGMLAPLPDTDFEPGTWLRRTVSADYRVTVFSSTYTVPYALAGRRVDVRVGRSAVEVFCDGERVATHRRARGRGEDVEQASHRPAWHTSFLERSGERYRQRASDEIGPWGRRVAEAMLAAGRAEEEGYRPCERLLALASERGRGAVESACERACGIARVPSLKTVRMLLDTRAEADGRRDAKEDYAILRDEGYYGRTRGGNAGEGVVA